MKQFFLFVLAAIFSLTACKNKVGEPVKPKKWLSKTPFLPVHLNKDTTVLHLEDFIADASLIRGVQADDSFTKILSADKTLCTLIASVNVPLLSVLTIETGSGDYSLVLKKSRKIEHTFSLNDVSGNHQSVAVAGDFNGWTPANSPMKKEGNNWSLKLSLNPGKYVYQMVVDGRWMLDPSNKDSVSNNMGGFNSPLQLGEISNTKAPRIFVDYAEGSLIRVVTRQFPENYIVLWDNIDITHMCQRTPSLCEIKIPHIARDEPSSVIRVYAWNRFGASNDLVVPLKYGKVVSDSRELTRHDKWGMMMYFLMVDRFSNGNVKNDQPVKDAMVFPKANYMGGDLEGVTDRLKHHYFTNLGLNTIWLSPVVQNPEIAYVEYPAPHRKYSGYHGYWPVSSTKVDHRFGSDESLLELVKKAHAADINVLIDYVSNHVHQEHPMFKQHPDWFTGIDLPDGRKNIRLWDEQRLTTWFDTFLPDLDYTKPEVINAVADSAIYWIDKFKVDGFRHDATKHVSEAFWRALTKKIKSRMGPEQADKLYQIGETFGSRELIGSYVSSGMQDAQFDFNFYFDARTALTAKNGSFLQLKQSMEESFMYYGYHNLMGNISGNHDIPRFITIADGSIAPGEDEKEAGWNRKITVKNAASYQKLAQLMALITTMPGIPVLYYGDEFGMPGAGDPDNRRMMEFEKLSDKEREQFKITRELFRIRKSNIALLLGDMDWLKEGEDVMAYARYYLDNVAIVFFNKSDQPQTIKVKVPQKYASSALKKHFDSKWSIIQNEISVVLPPHSFEILSSNF
jgi:cyclomaltodextrinase / maltogenic alpha-amylase / neopullulanase